MNKLSTKLDSKLLFFVAYTMAVFYWMFSNVKGVLNYRNKIINLVYVILVLVCAIQAKKYSIKTILIIIVSMVSYNGVNMVNAAAD